MILVNESVVVNFANTKLFSKFSKVDIVTLCNTYIQDVFMRCSQNKNLNWGFYNKQNASFEGTSGSVSSKS